MQLMPMISIPVAAIVLSGCSVTSIDYKTMTSQQLTASPQYLAIMPRVPAGKTVIGPVEATACQSVLTAAVPDHDDAILLLKQVAASKGANALAEVGSRLIPTRTDHCYSSAYAYGVAYID